MFLISQIVDYKLLPNYHCYFGSFPIELYELFIHHHFAWGGWGWTVEHLEIKCFCKDKDQATSLFQLQFHWLELFTCPHSDSMEWRLTVLVSRIREVYIGEY